jgi:predicted metal-dependent enzyme (double-stranded beta helix superfamily)
MAFDELIARIKLLLTEMQNQPGDEHELLEQIHAELAELKATGQPLPEDLVQLEKQLQELLRT